MQGSGFIASFKEEGEGRGMQFRTSSSGHGGFRIDGGAFFKRA